MRICDKILYLFVLFFPSFKTSVLFLLVTWIQYSELKRGSLMLSIHRLFPCAAVDVTAQLHKNATIPMPIDWSDFMPL